MALGDWSLLEEQRLGADGVYSPEAPAPTAKGGLRADKHFLLARRGGLGRDAVVSGSRGTTALVKVRQGPVRLYRMQTPVGWGGLPGRSGRAALWPPMPSPGLDHARIALFSVSQERGSSLGRGAGGPGAPCCAITRGWVAPGGAQLRAMEVAACWHIWHSSRGSTALAGR